MRENFCMRLGKSLTIAKDVDIFPDASLLSKISAIRNFLGKISVFYYRLFLKSSYKVKV